MKLHDLNSKFDEKYNISNQKEFYIFKHTDTRDGIFSFEVTVKYAQNMQNISLDNANTFINDIENIIQDYNDKKCKLASIGIDARNPLNYTFNLKFDTKQEFKEAALELGKLYYYFYNDSASVTITEDEIARKLKDRFYYALIDEDGDILTASTFSQDDFDIEKQKKLNTFKSRTFDL